MFQAGISSIVESSLSRGLKVIHMSDFTIVLPDVWELDQYYEAGIILNEPETGLTPVEAGVWEFAEKYKSARWHITLADKTYAFWGGDISYLWKDILPWLEEVRAGNQIATITNYAQGSEASIMVEPLGVQQLKVLIINNHTQPKFHEKFSPEDLPDQKHIVDKEDFILEWKMFALKLLLVITKEGFLDINQTDLRHYLTRVLKI